MVSFPICDCQLPICWVRTSNEKISRAKGKGAKRYRVSKGFLCAFAALREKSSSSSAKPVREIGNRKLAIGNDFIS